MSNNQSAEKEEFDDKRKELEKTCDPIVQKGMGKGGDAAGDEEDEFSDDDSL